MTPEALDLPDFLNRRLRRITKETPAVPETARIEHPIGKPLPDLSKVQPDTNGPDRDEFLFMVGQLEQADAKVADAKDARKKLRQHFSNRGVNLAAMDWAMAEAAKEDDTTLDNLRDQQRYAQYLGLPIGHQLSFFDAAPATASPSMDKMAQAFADGRERGIKGLNPDEQKWAPMLPEGQEHLRGWNAGQAVNLSKLRDLATGMTEAEKTAAKEKADKAKKKAERAAKKAAKNGGEPEPEAQADGGEEDSTEAAAVH